MVNGRSNGTCLMTRRNHGTPVIMEDIVNDVLFGEVLNCRIFVVGK